MNSIVRFEPRQTKRAFEHIVEQIRNLIYNGLVKPGERLPSERELAEQFQTARLAVREAFRVLEESGLIYIKKGKMGGAYIRELNATRVSRALMDTKENEMPRMEDLMEARAYIENIIVGLAIERIRPGNLRALKKNIAEAGRLISNEVSSAPVQVEFHILLARAAGNATLEMMLRSIMNVLQLFLLKGIEPSKDHLKRHLSEHENILKAIQEKKPELAKKLVEKHIQYFTKHFSVSRRPQLLKYKT
jgi:GntR family transcriptional regulator, transcriptional repressor for pyruvate dehydrogenase complex